MITSSTAATAPARPGAGRRLAERLGLTIVRQDGRDLRVAWGNAHCALSYP